MGKVDDADFSLLQLSFFDFTPGNVQAAMYKVSYSSLLLIL